VWTLLTILFRHGPPLCSSGQSSWLQIEGSGFLFPALPVFLRNTGSGTGFNQLVSTTEQLLERKSSDSGVENRDYGGRESAALATRHRSIRKSWH
jgi:hypothetical protein